ncbi:type II toxin-antitoxin system VapC family toxin [Thiomonas sp.]
MPFVIDNSVVCGWFLSNQATPYTEAIAQRLLDDTAIAPGLWPLELANVLRTACQRGALVAQRAQEISAEISALPITIDAQPQSPAALLALGVRFDLTSYDAAYLELALRLQLSIATQDEALMQAAMAAGVGVVR